MGIILQPILRINLSTSLIDEFDIPRKWELDYLGGASLAARLLYNELLPELDPLSPAASLIFLNGPLTGTSGPAVGRFVVCAKSPATGLWGESNCGGFWGPEQVFTDYGLQGKLIHQSIFRSSTIWLLFTQQTIYGVWIAIQH
jgi:aldehyde:ferredoxin oxidoreductase